MMGFLYKKQLLQVRRPLHHLQLNNSLSSNNKKSNKDRERFIRSEKVKRTTTTALLPPEDYLFLKSIGLQVRHRQ